MIARGSLMSLSEFSLAVLSSDQLPSSQQPPGIRAEILRLMREFRGHDNTEPESVSISKDTWVESLYVIRCPSMSQITTSRWNGVKYWDFFFSFFESVTLIAGDGRKSFLQLAQMRFLLNTLEQLKPHIILSSDAQTQRVEARLRKTILIEPIKTGG